MRPQPSARAGDDKTPQEDSTPDPDQWVRRLTQALQILDLARQVSGAVAPEAGPLATFCVGCAAASVTSVSDGAGGGPLGLEHPPGHRLQQGHVPARTDLQVVLADLALPGDEKVSGRAVHSAMCNSGHSAQHFPSRRAGTSRNPPPAGRYATRRRRAHRHRREMLDKLKWHRSR
ncbi:DUF6457 domain-containing protein [Kocuria sp. CPCC 205274]